MKSLICLIILIISQNIFAKTYKYTCTPNSNNNDVYVRLTNSYKLLPKIQKYDVGFIKTTLTDEYKEKCYQKIKDEQLTTPESRAIFRTLRSGVPDYSTKNLLKKHLADQMSLYAVEEQGCDFCSNDGSVNCDTKDCSSSGKIQDVITGQCRTSCSAGLVFNYKTNTCVDENFNCVSPEVKIKGFNYCSLPQELWDCEDGETWNHVSQICVPYDEEECSGNKQWNGTTCVENQEECPQGQSYNNDSPPICVSDCPNGGQMIDGEFVCNDYVCDDIQIDQSSICSVNGIFSNEGWFYHGTSRYTSYNNKMLYRCVTETVGHGSTIYHDYVIFQCEVGCEVNTEELQCDEGCAINGEAQMNIKCRQSR